jgi:hypothetical protein
MVTNNRTILTIRDGNVKIEHHGKQYGSYPASSIAVYLSPTREGNVIVRHFETILFDSPLDRVEVNGTQMDESNICDLTVELASGRGGGGGSSGGSAPPQARFVSVGGSTVSYSIDWKNWAQATTPVQAVWKNVVYGGGMWLVVGANTTGYLYSDDGINWHAGTLPYECHCLAYGLCDNGTSMFVGIATNGRYSIFSENGMSWGAKSIGFLPSGDNEIIYANGKFAVVFNFSFDVAFSSNGEAWDTYTIAPDNMPVTIAYGKGKYVTFGGNVTTNLAYSVDGQNWTGAQVNGGALYQKVIFDGRRFVAVCYDYLMIGFSNDGVNWTDFTPQISNVASSNFRAVAFYDGIYVAGFTYRSGGALVYSANGTDWVDTIGAHTSCTAVAARVDEAGGGNYTLVTDGSGNTVEDVTLSGSVFTVKKKIIPNMEFVAALPASPDSDTLYFIPEP